MTAQVSIITSVLNGSITLQRCMESVAYQTFPCEHIIVDAGSTDGTQSIVQKYKTKNLRLIDAPRTGISEAFNIGIEHASGDFIGILNADDWYELDAVARSFEILQRYSQFGFSYGSVIVHDGERQVLATPVPSNKLHSAIFKFMPFCHISSFVRRDVYQRYGMFDRKYCVAMDFDFYARIYSQGVSGVFVDGILGHVDSGGKSSSLKRRFPEYLAISSKHLSVWNALFYLINASVRGWIYNGIYKVPLVKDILRRIGFRTRFKEVA